MRYRFILEHALEYEVECMCGMLKVSRSGYYGWRDRLTQPVCKQKKLDEELTGRIRLIHSESRSTYGSPRVHAELKAQGIHCGKKRVERLMRNAELTGICRGRHRIRTTDSRHAYPTAENVLGQRFGEVTNVNTVWASDITYIQTSEGWLYLAAVMDVASRRIVGWSMKSSLERSLTLEALDMALIHRRPAFGALQGILHHSDRGSQYACEDYQNMLARNGLTASMSRRGNCYDNAVVESLFATLKTELLYRFTWETYADVRQAIFEYIEVWYNRKRRHSSLGYKSPVDYELMLKQNPRRSQNVLTATTANALVA